MATVYRQDFKLADGTEGEMTYGLMPCDWDDDENGDRCGFGPFVSGDAAHDWAARHLPGTDYTLVSMQQPCGAGEHK